MPRRGEQKVAIDVRDVRFLRAAREVLARYRLVRGQSGEDGHIAFQVLGGTEPYTVTVHATWAEAPTCTCPDARRGAKQHNAGYCKHIIAALLANEDLRCQLLELFL